jgi:hypothetical protein
LASISSALKALSSFSGFVYSFSVTKRVFVPTFDSIALLAVLGVDRFGAELVPLLARVVKQKDHPGE